MAFIKLFLLVLCMTFSSCQKSDSTEAVIDALRNEIDILVQELKKTNSFNEEVTKKLGTVTRQVMLQQLFIEERLRSEGNSGIKQVRVTNSGSKTYHAASHSGRRLAAMHEHSNNIRTVGLGEFIAVLNGVEFRTRHNDYRLYMPNTTSTNYHSFEEIPFPDVPPEVTEKKGVSEQAKEMREWFKAWRDSNYTVRDYRKYFKPVLCYLEGAWTKNTKKIDEPFESDRHFVDASSWFDLQEKIRFTSYAGRKDNLENYAYLPTTIMETVNDSSPVFAQWNYRIMCHPLKTDVPLTRFRLIDDLNSRLTFRKTMEEQARTRAARFQLNPDDSEKWRDRPQQFDFVDKLMEEIPGMDNYPAKLTDAAFGQAAYSLDPDKAGELVNAGYYHRWYKVLEKGAMGIQNRHRGFSDFSVFMAMNTQERIAGLKYETCSGRGRRKKCIETEQKWSYAIPLEIIYLTPLNKWNPYNLEYKGTYKSDEGKTVIANGRNGGSTTDKAYDGVNSKIYYLTPVEFFVGDGSKKDAADTARSSVGVLDPTGEVRRVRASGTRIFFPNIPGVGMLRQRYPIMPIHAEGSATWKMLQAVQDVLMDSQTHARLLREPFARHSSKEKDTDILLLSGLSKASKIIPHRHEVVLTREDFDNIIKNGEVEKFTSEIQGHQHKVKIGWLKKPKVFYMKKCDTDKEDLKRWDSRCFDKHRPGFTVVPDM